MIAELRADVRRHEGLGEPESWPLVVHRLGRAAQTLPRPLAAIGSKLYGLSCLALELTLGTVLHRETEIGEGLYLVHGFNIKIHPSAVLGARVALNHNVTIGLHHHLDGAPRIGDDVFIGTGATILGPVTIGDGAIIAAGSVVMNDIPAGATALGVPARPLPERKGNGGPSAAKQV